MLPVLVTKFVVGPLRVTAYLRTLPALYATSHTHAMQAFSICCVLHRGSSLKCVYTERTCQACQHCQHSAASTITLPPTHRNKPLCVCVCTHVCVSLQVVRAAHDIPATTELTLSYLGPQLFAPAAVRQAELKQQWGFDCGCNRCGRDKESILGRRGVKLVGCEMQHESGM